MILNVGKRQQTFVGFSPLRQLKGYTKLLLTAFKSIVNVHSSGWGTMFTSERLKGLFIDTY